MSMYGSHEYQFGTRQPLGPITTGQKLLTTPTAIISLGIRPLNVLEDRMNRSRLSGKKEDIFHIYEGPHQLNIEQGDMIFMARTEGPKDIIHDRNPFASFNGLEILDTPEQYRLRFRFMGIALTSFAFNNESQGKGISVEVRGTANFLNLTGAVLNPGDLLSWEPNIDHFRGDLEDPKTKRPRIAAAATIKGRFVKYDITEESVEATARAMGSDNRMNTLLHVLYDNPIAKNAELTQPNEWGRVILL